MKYCTHCGTELVDEAVVCTKCGCAVGTTGQIAPVVSEIDRKFVVGLLVVVLGIVGVIYSYHYDSSPLVPIIVGLVGAIMMRKPKKQYGYMINKTNKTKQSISKIGWKSMIAWTFIVVLLVIVLLKWVNIEVTL
jgi:uncharacterized membrane protein YvbJ